VRRTGSLYALQRRKKTHFLLTGIIATLLLVKCKNYEHLFFDKQEITSSDLIPDSLFESTVLDWNELNGKWGRESRRTVTGRGVGQWWNFSKVKDQKYISLTGYEYHGANWKLEHKREIDSTYAKFKLSKNGALIHYGNHRVTLAIKDSVLIDNAFVLRAENDWIYTNDHITFRYKFMDDPLKSSEGQVAIWRDYRKEQMQFKETYSFYIQDFNNGKQVKIINKDPYSVFPLPDLYFLDRFKDIKLASFAENIEAFIYSRNGYPMSYDLPSSIELGH